ncbi:MAG: hypothetical protein IJ329_05055 [Clostridia bacterium]|nr:hypothetical protein [Clostridia bacterium]MBQ7924653.1 hypothetical protein [Clostridia bacterium]
MEIDIITFTDGQYATLSETQLQEVYKAQEKKDKLTWRLEEDKREEKHRLVKNGTFVSGIWTAYCEQLQSQYEKEVSFIREALLFYLQFSMKADGEAPYRVDYSLSLSERAAIVRVYYTQTYDDANERFESFKADTVAVQYLGELYAPTWDYFYLQTQ